MKDKLIRKHKLNVVVNILLCIFSLTSCSKGSDKKDVDMSMYINDDYIAKTAVDEKEDGWVYYGSYIESKEKPSEHSFYFSAKNLKYESLDDYKIEVVN